MTQLVGERAATGGRVIVLLYKAGGFRIAIEIRKPARGETLHPVDQKYVHQCSGGTAVGKHVQYELIAGARTFWKIQRGVENDVLFQVELNVGRHPDGIGDTQGVG